jgi:hypothetical protein
MLLLKSLFRLRSSRPSAVQKSTSKLLGGLSNEEQTKRLTQLIKLSHPPLPHIIARHPKPGSNTPLTTALPCPTKSKPRPPHNPAPAVTSRPTLKLTPTPTSQNTTSNHSWNTTSNAPTRSIAASGPALPPIPRSPSPSASGTKSSSPKN